MLSHRRQNHPCCLAPVEVGHAVRCVQGKNEFAQIAWVVRRKAQICPIEPGNLGESPEIERRGRVVARREGSIRCPAREIDVDEGCLRGRRKNGNRGDGGEQKTHKHAIGCDERAKRCKGLNLRDFTTTEKHRSGGSGNLQRTSTKARRFRLPGPKGSNLIMNGGI
jgi:hypothetical protein